MFVVAHAERDVRRVVGTLDTIKLALLLLASTLDGAAAAVAADEVDGPSLPGYGARCPAGTTAAT
jgi:hypothetical protein